MRTMRFVLLALLLLVSSLAQAQRIYDITDEELEDETKWKELTTKLPAYPKVANAVEIEVGPFRDNRVFIDLDSLGVGADGVVRYTLIIKSGGGALNVSFEGMRCITQQRKTYGFAVRKFGALASEPGEWRPARSSEWAPIIRDSTRPHFYVLYTDFFCPARKAGPDEFKEIARRIKRSTKPAGPGDF
jgi:CNP1-like family